MDSVPHGIMLHHFHGAKNHLKTQGSISGEEFTKLLEFLGPERIISPNKWLRKLEEGKLDPSDLCLTFDDALLCQVDIALPVLENFGLQAFWFVYSGVFEGVMENLEIYRLFRTKFFDSIDDFYKTFFQKVAESGFAKSVDPNEEAHDQKEKQKLYPFQSFEDNRFRFYRDRVLGRECYESIMESLLVDRGVHKQKLAKNLWMSNSDLRYLVENNHVIGLHSYSHPTTLAGLTLRDQRQEYQKNYEHLSSVAGVGPVSVSHPCNSYNADTLSILRELNVRCGFRSNMFIPTGQKRLNPNGLELAREDHANIMPMIYG